MEALSDPTRLAIVAFLASLSDGAIETQCGAFTCFGSKSNLTYHLARLREAGVTRTRVAGTARLISLRTDDLDERFPGLLTSVIAAALSEPARAETVRQALGRAQRDDGRFRIGTGPACVALAPHLPYGVSDGVLTVSRASGTAARGAASMLISDHTLLLAIGFSALCVVVMFIVTWFSTRSEAFLLTWAAGTGVIVFSAFGFAVYNINMTPWVGLITFAAMIIGLGIQFSASLQFRTGQLPFLITGPVILLGVLAVGNAMFSGYNGIAIMIAQGFAALFLAAAAFEYWKARAEAPKALTIMALLNLATSLCFVMSCGVLVLDGETMLNCGAAQLGRDARQGRDDRHRHRHGLDRPRPQPLADREAPLAGGQDELRARGPSHRARILGNSGVSRAKAASPLRSCSGSGRLSRADLQLLESAQQPPQSCAGSVTGPARKQFGQGASSMLPARSAGVSTPSKMMRGKSSPFLLRSIWVSPPDEALQLSMMSCTEVKP